MDCYPVWSNESDAVAQIIFYAHPYTYTCSGSLVSNTAQDYRPYFLTAFHCIDIDIINGCVDGMLSPAEISRVGSIPVNATCIHHPDGMPMKISFDYGNPYGPYINNYRISWGCSLYSPASTHWVVGFESGTTEGGSSGSPLFNSSQRVIGQLHGGDFGCAPITKLFGQFSKSWTGGGSSSTRLSDWLNPTGSTATTTNTIKLGVSITGSTSIGNNGEYTASITGCTNSSNNNYIWSVTPSNGANIAYYFGPNNSYAGINFTQAGYYDIKAQITTSCGTQYAIKKVYANPYKGGGSGITFPNPVDNILYIDLDQIADVTFINAKTFDIRLFDAQGSMVRHSQAQSGIIQYNVSNLPDGIYYLRINDGISASIDIYKIIVKH